MAPSFFKEFRRRSKSSFRTNRSTESSEGSSGSGGTMPTTKSSSTLNSLYGTNTSASGLHASNSTPNIPQLGNSSPVQNGTRPPLATSTSKRYSSVSGMSGLGSPSSNGAPPLPTSPYAPRITSINDGSMVYQKLLSVSGTIGEATSQSIEGNLTVSRLDDSFPSAQWPVCRSHFKALVFLTPGPNKLRFEFSSPKLANSSSSNNIHTSYINVHMMPMTNTPPLQLVVLLAKDSPATFDSTPACIEKEGNGLETAVKKFRMAAYLWQAFTAEQMHRNKLGRRCFRFEEEWQTGTSNSRDREQNTMRNEAKVHIVTCDKTVEELRDLDLAQQNPNAQRAGDLFSIAHDAIKAHFNLLPGQKQYVSCLILDSHWDREANMIRGHAALGGGTSDIGLAVFGSQALYSYPSTIDEVVTAFTDCTPTDTVYVANDCNESGSRWEAANIGIGAHLHETGHLFGCPHQESGVMLRDYTRLDRSFITDEAFSTRTNSKAGLVLQTDECTWHRLDCLRFRSHPCFKLPTDPTTTADSSIRIWPVENGNIIVTAPSGVAYTEIFREGDDTCHYWIEHGDGISYGPLQRQILLTEQDIRNRLPESERKSKTKIRLSIKSVGGGSVDVADIGQTVKKASMIKLSNGQVAFRGDKHGLSQLEGSEPQEIIFSSALRSKSIMISVTVYHGFAVDGLEFFYEDSSSQLFGKRGGSADEFPLDTRKGEIISGFNIRSGFWVDAIQVITNMGRKSEMWGNASGGSGGAVMPPRGYSVAGLSGSCGQWMDGLALIITRY